MPYNKDSVKHLQSNHEFYDVRLLRIMQSRQIAGLKTIKLYRSSCKAAQQSLGVSNSILYTFWTAFILSAVLLPCPDAALWLYWKGQIPAVEMPTNTPISDQASDPAIPMNLGKSQWIQTRKQHDLTWKCRCKPQDNTTIELKWGWHCCNSLCFHHLKSKIIRQQGNWLT